MQINWKQWWLGLILVVALFTRTWNLWDSLQFQGDQGRDAIVVSQIFTERDLVFIGPVTSVGNMYLGPLYYYFMLPFLWLSYPNPIGPVYAVAALGILTVYLIYRWGKAWVGETAALLAATVYALSANFALYSRFSWNPNPAPLVSLMTLWGVWLALKKSPLYWWLVSLGISILIQLHYVTLLVAGAAAGVWVFEQLKAILAAQHSKAFLKNYWAETQKLWLGSFLALGIFLVSLTPLMLFDWKHDWLNAKAFQSLLFKGETFDAQAAETKIEKLWTILKETDGRSLQILAEINLGKQRDLNHGVVAVILASLLYLLWKNRGHKNFTGLALIAWWLLVGILGTAAYQHSVFDHYIAYLFPITALLYGVTLANLTKWRWGKLPVGNLLVVAALVGLAAYNIPRWPIKSTGWKVSDIWSTSKTIQDRVKPGEKYNIVLLSESKDLEGQNYRYFLTTDQSRKPVTVEHRAEAETLFIINEEKKLSNVLNSPAYEIVTFPNKIPAEVYQIPNGPEITVLRRDNSLKP